MLLQFAPRSIQAGPDRAFGHIQRLRDLLVRQIVHLAEQENAPQFGIQPRQRLFQHISVTRLFFVRTSLVFGVPLQAVDTPPPCPPPVLFEPNVETKNRKSLLQPAPFAAQWEVRFGPDNRFRVLYDIDEAQLAVQVVAIGEKVGNRLIVGGEEVEL
jgi:hypothetical protein